MARKGRGVCVPASTNPLPWIRFFRTAACQARMWQNVSVSLKPSYLSYGRTRSGVSGFRPSRGYATSSNARPASCLDTVAMMTTWCNRPPSRLVSIQRTNVSAVSARSAKRSKNEIGSFFDAHLRQDDCFIIQFAVGLEQAIVLGARFC